MKKIVFTITIILIFIIAGLSGCINDTKNEDNTNNKNTQSKLVGTWISPDIYNKKYYMLQKFNSDGTFENKLYGSYKYESKGTWKVIDDNTFHMDSTTTSSGNTQTSSEDLDYYLTDDDTLIYGNPNASSPGNALQFYRLDGSFKIIFKFEAKPSEIYSGSEVNLSWLIIGGSIFSIDNGIGNVERMGYTKVNPTETTKYILTVKDGSKTYNANTTVTIIEDESQNSDNYPIATFDTTKGTMKIMLFDDKVPNTVANFIKLAEDGFYDGMIFHRVMDNFMIQAGNTYPNGTTKESPYGNIEFETNPDIKHVDGAISMASTGWSVGGSSQFFICDGAQTGLDGGYAPFGVLMEGFDVLRDIADEPHDSSYGYAGGGRPNTDIIINSITIEYP